jgi:hypothetical protein
MRSSDLSPLSHTHSATTTTFVRRLERLIRLRREYSQDLNPLGLRLLDRSIHATYKDCIDFGAAEQAEDLLAQHPVPGWDKDI